MQKNTIRFERALCIKPFSNKYSILQIRDGNDSTSALLGELKGASVTQYMLSSTPAVFLIFSADAPIVSDGYNVTWEAKLSKPFVL